MWSGVTTSLENGIYTQDIKQGQTFYVRITGKYKIETYNGELHTYIYPYTGEGTLTMKSGWTLASTSPLS